MSTALHASAATSPHLLVLALVLGSAGCSSETATPALPALKLDPARTTVSGLSSGGYMATQVHLAFSNRIAGVALLAGGPYGCAAGSLETALGRCLAPADGAGPEPDALAARVRERAQAGQLAALEGIDGDRVYVWHGALDTTVGATVSAAGAELYRRLGVERVVEDNARNIAHTFPTETAGSACTASEAPYLGKCAFDGAREIFANLYAEMISEAGAADGELRRFDQDAYRTDGRDVQLAPRGYVYIPKACAAGETCGLHIALHGCQQNVDSVGEAFVREAGYNRWADAYRVVVLYPQTRATFAPLNPKACWDWWGYSGADYDTRSGAQLRWLAAATRALGAPLD